MNILLTGATGFIAYHLLPELLARGHRVIACCRQPENLIIKHPQLTTVSIDFNVINDYVQCLAYLNNIDVIINCVGIIAEIKNNCFQQLHTNAPIALFKAAEHCHINKIIQISALGADAEAQSAYHQSKRAADEFLQSLPLNWFILQPSIIYGDGAPSTAFLQALAALPIQLLPNGGKQQLQPIHISDVITAICQCLNHEQAAKQIIALVGLNAISYSELLQQLRARFTKKSAIYINISQKTMNFFSYFSGFLAEPILSKDSIAMLNRSNCADVSALTLLLNRPPLAITQQLFEQPLTTAEYYYTQLYFFKPLLGFVIAFVWLWSGLTSLFFYPHQLSYQLLAALGITGVFAPISLYTLALMDISLGVATLWRYRLRALLRWQFYIVLCYSLVLSYYLPEFLWHPFAPIIKNIPFLLCLIIYKQLLGEKS
ncbi:MAG: SDR family oxidoreductase [Methylococcaceae bacterium]